MAVSNKFLKLLADKGVNESRRISIAEVARITGIDQRTLGSWSRNTITRYDAQVINALCKYFDCAVSDILVYTPDLPTE